jgi:hypothetical protein
VVGAGTATRVGGACGGYGLSPGADGERVDGEKTVEQSVSPPPSCECEDGKVNRICPLVCARCVQPSASGIQQPQGSSVHKTTTAQERTVMLLLKKRERFRFHGYSDGHRCIKIDNNVAFHDQFT